MRTYTDAGALIDDPRVLALHVVDNGEPLVDISDTTRLVIDKTRTGIQTLSDNPFLVRSGVADRLARVEARLPDEYRLQLKEGWRPIWVQERLWQLNLDRLRARRPDLGEDELTRENSRFVAPPTVAPPHSTGGAVDVTLLHRGEDADMGWGFNEPGAGSRTAHPVGESARCNRDLLAYAMDAVGFVNYPAEWWHWSYGDRYWAYQTCQQVAYYGPR